ncbi:hypothetical protein CLOP_g17293, partial [Closterium sp. NIES-67]
LQRQKFTYRRKGDVGSTREVIASPARSVNPFNWNFPRLVRNEQERLVPARGFSHGGPRQGTEYEAMARQAGHILGSSGEPMQASTAPLEERTGGPGMCPHVSAHAENMQQEDGVAGVGRAVEQRGGGAVEDVLAGAGAPLVSDGPTRDRPATVRDGTPRRGARGRGRGKALEGWPEMRTLDRVPAGTERIPTQTDESSVDSALRRPFRRPRRLPTWFDDYIVMDDNNVDNSAGRKREKSLQQVEGQCLRTHPWHVVVVADAPACLGMLLRLSLDSLLLVVRYVHANWYKMYTTGVGE